MVTLINVLYWLFAFLFEHDMNKYCEVWFDSIYVRVSTITAIYHGRRRRGSTGDVPPIAFRVRGHAIQNVPNFLVIIILFSLQF